MKRIENVIFAISLGVDYLGFITEVENSKRSISFRELELINEKLTNLNLRKKVKLVCVVVNPDKTLLGKILNSEIIDVIQFHGNESIEFLKSIRLRVNGKKIWKAISPENFDTVEDYLKVVDKILLDATNLKNKINGEKSENFSNFEIFKNLQKRCCNPILAGGLDEENIDFYIKKLQPKIVDVCSGIEISPGVKDEGKMRRFIENLKI